MLKNKSIMIGDGLADIFKMMLSYAKNILPKLATTFGLSSIGVLASNAINKNMNKEIKMILLLNQTIDKLKKLMIILKK